MNASVTVLKVILAALVVAPLLRASSEDLINNPPFLSAGAVAGAPTAAPGSPELRGVVRTGNDIEFSIYDPTSKRSDWVKLKQKGGDYVVRDYDAQHDSATIEYQGRTVKLALQEAKIVASPQNLPPQAAMPPAAPGQAPQPVAAVSPNSPNEQQRLDAIAEEIRRRRAMRQQAAAQPGPTPR